MNWKEIERRGNIEWSIEVSLSKPKHRDFTVMQLFIRKI